MFQSKIIRADSKLCNGWRIIINHGRYLIVGCCKFVTCIFMGIVKCVTFIANKFCIHETCEIHLERNNQWVP